MESFAKYRDRQRFAAVPTFFCPQAGYQAFLCLSAPLREIWPCPGQAVAPSRPLQGVPPALEYSLQWWKALLSGFTLATPRVVPFGLPQVVFWRRRRYRANHGCTLVPARDFCNTVSSAASVATAVSRRLCSGQPHHRRGVPRSPCFASDFSRCSSVVLLVSLH